MPRWLKWTLGIIAIPLVVFYVVPVCLVAGGYAWVGSKHTWAWALNEWGEVTSNSQKVVQHAKEKSKLIPEKVQSEIDKLRRQVEALTAKTAQQRQAPAPIATTQQPVPVVTVLQPQPAVAQPAIVTAAVQQPTGAPAPRHLGFHKVWEEKLKAAGCTQTGAGPNGRLHWNCPCHDAAGLPVACSDPRAVDSPPK